MDNLIDHPFWLVFVITLIFVGWLNGTTIISRIKHKKRRHDKQRKSNDHCTWSGYNNPSSSSVPNNEGSDSSDGSNLCSNVVIESSNQTC